MNDNFQKCIKLVINSEGGFVDDPNDNGGATKYGISLRFLKTTKPDATVQDIMNLSLSDAEIIYFKHFWQQYKCDRLPLPLAYMLFDMVVNMNPKVSIRILQSALGVSVDGCIGTLTISAASNCYLFNVIPNVTKGRKVHYSKICEKDNSQYKFLKGWTKRAEDVEKNARGFIK